MFSVDIYTILSSKPHNPHYLNRYWKFIQELQHQQKIIGKTHHHHICPKAKDLFQEYSKIKEHPWNGIHLTYRQHFIAHWFLYKAYGGSQAYAFIMLSRILNRNASHKISSRMFAKLSHDHSIRITGSGNPFYNKKHTQETIDRLKSFSGENHHAYKSTLSEETKAKQGDSRAKIWYVVTTPDNKQLIIRNMNKFCRDNSLSPSAMNRIANGHQKYIRATPVNIYMINIPFLFE